VIVDEVNVGLMQWDPDIPWTFPFHHHRLPIYNVNVYQIDSGRSVIVRSLG